MSDSIATQLAALEARVRRLEDEQEIAQLISGYGPLVDGAQADAVAALWTVDGVYDVDEVLLEGSPAIAAMVRSRPHQAWLAGGCAHVLSPARVHVTGDDAVAVCHSLMIVAGAGTFEEGGAFAVRRASAHHWVLVRTPSGWKVTRRTSRVLDGRHEARALLAHGGLGQRLPEAT
jgi:hypothetical protein